jgi:hypothetical protein
VGRLPVWYFYIETLFGEGEKDRAEEIRKVRSGNGRKLLAGLVFFRSAVASLLDSNQWHSYGKILKNERRKAKEYKPSCDYAKMCILTCTRILL